MGIRMCMCLHACDATLNDQHVGWTHWDGTNRTHTCLCVLFSSLLFLSSSLLLCFFLPTFTLSLYVPLHLLQLLKPSYMPFFFYPPPTLDRSYLSHMVCSPTFFFWSISALFASFPTHFTPPFICWSFVLRDTEWGRKWEGQQQKKSGPTFFCNVLYTGGP